MLSTELYWLNITVLFTSLMWMPYIINRMAEIGIWTALYNPQPDIQPRALWAKRMMLAHDNAVENLIIFAPLVLMTELSGLNSDITALAVVIYFFARLSHFVVFTFAIPLLRVIAFLVGVAAQLMLVLNLLTIL